MKALTKGQYEGIGRILNNFYNGISDEKSHQTIEALIYVLADTFNTSDPEFKRELFLKGCGIDEEA